MAARYKFTRSVSSPLPPAAAPTPSLITPNQPKTKNPTRLLPIPDVAGGFAGAASTVSHPRLSPAHLPLPISSCARGIVVRVSFRPPCTRSRVSMRPPGFCPPVSRLKFARAVASRCLCLLIRVRSDVIAGCFVRVQRSMASLAPPSSSVAALTRQP